MIRRRTPRANWTTRREAAMLLWVVAAIVAVVAVGTIGYMVLFGWSFLDALFQTVTTISTVGFREIRELTAGGRIFTMLLILGGVGVILYGLATIFETAIKAQLSGVFKRRAVKKRVDRLKNHYIICGYGRVGESVASHFSAQGAAFVVVDNDQGSLARAEAAGLLVVEGDATSDEALSAAGITRARGVVAAVGSDADNLYVTLSARVLNPDLLIVARASSEDTANKLRRAGADRVVSPYGIGGRQMAVLMMKPLVSDYLDVVTGDGALEFRVEELRLTERCCAVGRSIREMSVREATGATILAVRKGETGSFDTNPSPEVVLQSGDTVIAIGTPQEITKLEGLVGVTGVPQKQGV